MAQLSRPSTALAPDEREDNISRFTQRSVIGMALVSTGILIGWLILAGRPASLQLQFNWYALLSAASFISNIGALLLISRIKVRTPALVWFSLHLLSLAAWAGGEAIIRMGATPEASQFWSPWTTLGSMFMPISLYMFVLSYTNSKRAQQPLTFLSLVSGTILFIFADAHTRLLTDYSAATMLPSGWGYVPLTGPAYPLISVWLIFVCAVSMVVLYRFRKQTIEPTLRQQTKLFMIAIAIPLVGGGVTDGILPAFNVVWVPPMAATLLTTMGIIISYGILRYRFFRITPNLIAGRILDTMNEAVIGLDENLHVSFANAGAERLLGHSANNLARRQFGSLLVQAWSSAQLQENLNHVLGNREVGTLDSVDFHGPKGGILTTKLSITRIYNDDQPFGYLIVMTDITAIAQAAAIIEEEVARQTKAVRETRTKLVNSINSLGMGFLITDDKPAITLMNNAAHKLFCGSHDHAAAKCPEATLEAIQDKLGEDTPLIKEIRHSLKLQRPQEIKLVTFHDRNWRVFVSPMLDGGRSSGTAVIVQDITEEQVLARSHDEFFSLASHELRTPLTAIKGNAAMMLDYYPDQLKEPSLHEMVTDIRGSSDRLITIVNDFLDVSSLEQGKIGFHPAEVKVAGVAAAVMAELAPAAQERGVHLHLGEGLRGAHLAPAVIADPDKLKQILYNLVDNAIKATGKGHVTMEAEAAHNRLKIHVTDTGRGLSPDMQHLLFRKFQQAGDSLLTRDTAKGTGLGLYISRLLAKGMHGTVELTYSEEGKGSVFTVMLPLATPDRVKRLQLTTKKAVVDTQSGLAATDAKTN
jgi:PAS domain S-box-containing protein